MWDEPLSAFSQPMTFWLCTAAWDIGEMIGRVGWWAVLRVLDKLYCMWAKIGDEPMTSLSLSMKMEKAWQRKEVAVVSGQNKICLAVSACCRHCLHRDDDCHFCAWNLCWVGIQRWISLTIVARWCGVSFRSAESRPSVSIVSSLDVLSPCLLAI